MLAKLTIIALCAIAASSKHSHSTSHHHHSSTKVQNITTDPKPYIPENFEAFYRSFKWNSTFHDLGTWSEVKYSTDMNMVYESTGTFNKAFERIVDSTTVQSLNEQEYQSYTSQSGCKQGDTTESKNVSSILDYYRYPQLDGIFYGGLVYPDWDSSEKYHVFSGHGMVGVAYYYKQDTMTLKYFSELKGATVRYAEVYTLVYDFGPGLIEKDLTANDFAIAQCQSTAKVHSHHHHHSSHNFLHN